MDVNGRIDELGTEFLREHGQAASDAVTMALRLRRIASEAPSLWEWAVRCVSRHDQCSSLIKFCDGRLICERATAGLCRHWQQVAGVASNLI